MVAKKDVIDVIQEGVLAVQGIDFCIESNGENHHTSKYDLMTRSVDRCLVVRRGQAFKLDILVNRPYDAARDALSFIFYVADGEKRGPSNEMTAAVPMLEKGSEVVGAWSAVYEGQVASHLMVAVTPAADCIVAAWRLDVDTKLSAGGSLSYTHPLPIYVLFNPWCLNDTVYMPEHSHREEYVNDDTGLIYQDMNNSIFPKLWLYAQYEKDILECALYLVREIGKVKGRARSDPIRTVRALSAAVNVEDDNGVLVGRWPKDPSGFAGGSEPGVWFTSYAILQKFYEKKKPVKYAQCWVFAGVLTTRKKGCKRLKHEIDRQGSLTIDIIIDTDGNALDELTEDFSWSFHVWNEVWMDRPDLGPDYGGWQAIDSTPQETSEDVHRLGPSSLKAVRDGELQRPYDVSYVFAQVNADLVYWKFAGENQPYKLMGSDTTSIGRSISTKAVGKMEREDITHLYKSPERTFEERQNMEKLLSKSDDGVARKYFNNAFKDVVFKFEHNNDFEIGRDFTVTLHMENRSPTEKYTLNGVFQVNAMKSTEATGDSVKRNEFDMVLPPEEKGQITMQVTFDEYFKNRIDQASFKITCLATIVERDFDFFTVDYFRVKNPDIKIAVDSKPVSLQEFNATVTLENPLPVPLKKGKFYIKVLGLNEYREIELSEIVPPGEFATAQFKLTPPRAGRLLIHSVFISNEIYDIYSFLTLMVSASDTTETR